MRKSLCALNIAALSLLSVASFAANQKVVLKPTNKGTPVTKGHFKSLRPDNPSLNHLKAQNHLSPAVNNAIKAQQKGAAFHNCSGFLTIPCFNSWFITGYRNSVYQYSMVGQDPTAGGTTTVTNRLIPLTILLIDQNGNLLYVFDPTVATDPEGNDVDLLKQSPIYVTTAYPGGGGLSPDRGQFADTVLRASLTGVKKPNWRTVLGAPQSPVGGPYAAALSYNNGDWACFFSGVPPCGSGDFPVVNIDSINNIFLQLLGPGFENVPSTIIPVIETDFVTAFEGNQCCALGFHSATPGNEGGNAVSVWTWATFIPHAPDGGFTNPFFPFGQDSFVMSHEISELYADPFVNTLISPWIDGSASFAQANLETGDAVEAMNDVDADWPVNSTTTGGPYTFHVQTEATLQWFTRNPKGPATGPGSGVYSWPNTHTLNNGHPCGSQDFIYGEGPAGFFADDGTANGQCR